MPVIILFLLRTALLFALVLCISCTLSPRDRLDLVAERYGMQEVEVSSSRFTHLLYRNFNQANTDTLNVYLEGDGSPWFFRMFPSVDPTPRSPLMLRLMSSDRDPSIYLGRPCYNERERSKHCNSRYWTSGRYSTAVVDSMAAVLAKEIERLDARSVNLFGHSGGATLALLLAEKTPAIVRVVTLAGNINTDAWIAHHRYSKLYTSLNPVKRAALPQRIEQVHLMGLQDVNIPPVLARDWIASQHNSYGVLYENFNHSCCWHRIWDDVLKTLRNGPPYEFSGKVFKTPSRSALGQLIAPARVRVATESQ